MQNCSSPVLKGWDGGPPSELFKLESYSSAARGVLTLTDHNGRKPIALSHLSDSDDLKKDIGKAAIFPIFLKKGVVIHLNI